MTKLWKIFSILFYAILIIDIIISATIVTYGFNNVYSLCLLIPLLIIPYFLFARYYKKTYYLVINKHQKEIQREYNCTEQIIKDNVELRKNVTDLNDENEVLKIIATSPSGKQMN